MKRDYEAQAAQVRQAAAVQLADAVDGFLRCVDVDERERLADAESAHGPTGDAGAARDDDAGANDTPIGQALPAEPDAAGGVRLVNAPLDERVAVLVIRLDELHGYLALYRGAEDTADELDRRARVDSFATTAGSLIGVAAGGLLSRLVWARHQRRRALPPA